VKNLDLSKKLKNLDGSDAMDTEARALAASLSNQTEGDAVKLWSWALCLWKEHKIQVDDSDLQTLIDHTSGSKQLPIWAKGPILTTLRAAANRPEITEQK
jgi:hypothetical protein